MQNSSFVIGVDYGTDSVRSVIVDTTQGDEIASAIYYYPRWRDGMYCDPSTNQFRQHPLDYIEGLETTIKEALYKAGEVARLNIKGIAIDTTGSTPVAVDQSGTPLGLLPTFENNPNAQFILWKDHTATAEAAEINEAAKKFPVDYLKYVGGIYSSEWFWAKLLRILRVDDDVRKACHSWVEHCDWIPFLLTGGTDVKKMKRSVCAAGHKALWASAFGGLPPNEFFVAIDPLLDGFNSRLFSDTFTSDKAAGFLSSEWASRLGLSTEVVIAVGAFDAHMGAVGGQIQPYHLSKVMGTSTCDMLVAPIEEIGDKSIRGICGQVPGSVIPGMMGMEAGQSAFGDTYAWWKSILSWPLQLLSSTTLIEPSVAQALNKEISDKIISELSIQAKLLPLDEDDELAVDWLNGRRTPDANQELTASIMNLNLGTGAPQVFKALVEATCFGARAIAERFVDEGVPVKGLIGLGGVAKKSPYIMQTMADVMRMPIRIHKSEQTCAAGAAMFAATAAGIFPSVVVAMETMGQGFDAEYKPQKSKEKLYTRRYKRYLKLGKFIEKN